MRYDMLVRGGQVIDPARKLNGRCDIAVKEGKIAAVAPDILPASATRVIDASGKLVLPGLVDTHAHVYEFVTGRFGLDADLVGVRSGVTTLIDQGGPSCMTLPGFRELIVKTKHSRVVAFLSAYLVGGMEGHYFPELYKPDCVNVEATVRAAAGNRHRPPLSAYAVRSHACEPRRCSRARAAVRCSMSMRSRMRSCG